MRIALQARWLFPVIAPPIRDGVLTLEDDRIVAVGENTSGRPPRDLGNVAILPGLINAHTHLEFSELERPIGQAGMPFADWIERVVRQRREQAAAEGENWPHRRRAAVERGLHECGQTGAIAVGEIATQPWCRDIFANSPLDATVFLELIGLSAGRIDERLQAAAEHLALGNTPANSFRVGLSPHAPYTVHPELLARAVKLSMETRTPLAMHLAESFEELELLQSGSGPLVDLLRRLEAWDPTAIPRGLRPLDYLERLADVHRALVIHGNFLGDDEIAFLAEHSATMSVVYCPRTHAYFGHGRYPLEKMLAAGVRVALGTDSRASNPDLSVFAEMCEVRRCFSELPSEQILPLATINAAAALGLPSLGGMFVGERASLTVVDLPESLAADDPHELLFRGDHPRDLATQVASLFGSPSGN